MFLLLLLTQVGLSQCLLDPSPEASFRLAPPDPNPSTHIQLEIWAEEPSSSWVSQLIEQVEMINGAANLIIKVPSQKWNADQLDRLQAIHDNGHSLALRRTERELSTVEIGLIKVANRQLKSIGAKSHMIVTPLLKRGVEATLGTLGFTSIVQTNAPSGSLPRYTVVRPGRPNLGVLIPPGNYNGACGSTPKISVLSPASLDRVTRAIHASYAHQGVGVVRLVLQESAKQQTDIEVFSRWLSGPMKAWGSQFSPSLSIRRDTLKFLRIGSAENVDPSRVTGGKIVPFTALLEAAEELEKSSRIQPTYGQEQLNPTEMFVGFAKILTDNAIADGVQLEVLDGPVSLATSSLVGPKNLDRQKIIVAAREFLSHMPARVPAALRVGATLLTADEFLALMAAALLTDQDTVITRPIQPNEPNQPGLGWGQADID